MAAEKIKVGISSCLLGMKVRFDGGHKHDRFLTGKLGKYFDWVAVCPEIEIGMGTPRENVRLVGDISNPKMIAPKSGSDYTEKMLKYADERLEKLRSSDLSGYILKKDSPSCGMERVRVYDHNNVPQRNGIGIFARKLMEAFPLLPVEEEGRLNDPLLRENFIARVFAYRDLQKFLRSDPTPGGLVKFHTAYKLTVMAHNPVNYRALGRLVAQSGGENFSEILTQYCTLLMETLKQRASARKHANVLYHILGYFKRDIDTGDKQEIVDTIELYRKGMVPLVVPISLLKHHLRRNPVAWINEQAYMNPYPQELMLRNNI